MAAMVEQEIAALLDELHAFGDEHGGMWNISPETGRFLHVQLQLMDAQQVLEVGTSNGYSTIWMADALARTDGALVTLEMNPDKIRMATDNLARAGLQDRVTIVPGDARETIRTLTGPFDLVLIDADKESYVTYFDVARALVRPGGLIVADNVASHATALEAFIARAEGDPGLETFRLPFGGGQLVAFVRPPSLFQPVENHRF